MSKKNLPASFLIPPYYKAFLEKHFLKISDVMYYGLLCIERTLNKEGYPRCIYIRTQNRATPRHGCLIQHSDPSPRTCIELCGTPTPDRAASSIHELTEDERSNLLLEFPYVL